MVSFAWFAPVAVRVLYRSLMSRHARQSFRKVPETCIPAFTVTKL